MGHRSDPNAELTGDGTQGLAAADGGYHGATPLGLTLCLLMRLPRHGAVDYLDTEPFQANCSPPLFGTYWHETVRDVLALTPLFVEGYQQDTGGEPSHAVRWFAKQIEKLRAMGVHCSSSVIATLLRELAKP